MKKILLVIALLMLLLGVCGCDKNSSNDQNIIIAKNNNLYYALNAKGEYEFEKGYSELAYMPNDQIYCFKEDNMFGILNEKGKVKINAKYNYMKCNDNGLIEVKQNKKYGVINTNERQIIPLEYDDVYISNDNYITLYKDGKYGFANKRGNIIIDLIYEDKDYCHGDTIMTNGKVIINNNDKYKVIDSKKNILISDYDIIYILNSYYICGKYKETLFGQDLYIYDIYDNDCKKINKNTIYTIWEGAGNVAILNDQEQGYIYNNTWDIVYAISDTLNYCDGSIDFGNGQFYSLTYMNGITTICYNNVKYTLSAKQDLLLIIDKNMIVKEDNKIRLCSLKGEYLSEYSFDEYQVIYNKEQIGSEKISGEGNDKLVIQYDQYSQLWYFIVNSNIQNEILVNNKIVVIDDKIKRIECGYIITEENGQVGIRDFNNNILINTEFEEINIYKR